MRNQPLEFSSSVLRHAILALSAALLCMLTGCRPEMVVVWAPDGVHALVKGSDGTYVADADGRIIGEAPSARVWMPDSRRVIAVRRVKAITWDEVAGLVGPDRAKLVVSAAENLEWMLLNYHGDWDAFFHTPAFDLWEKSIETLRADSAESKSARGGISLPFFYLYQKNPEALKPLEKGLANFVKVDRTQSYPRVNGDDFDKEERLNEPGAFFDCAIYEMVIRSAFPGDGEKEVIVFRTVDNIRWEQPSPNGEWIAAIIDEPGNPRLYAMTAEGGERQAIDAGAEEASWSPDNASLIYAKTPIPFVAAEDHVVMGTITRRQLAAKGARAGDPKDLAEVLFARDCNRVACLPDGRILFASAGATFPAIHPNQQSGVHLFVMDAGGTKIERLLSDEDSSRLPELLGFFSLSPDGRHVAVLGVNGEVDVISLESRKVQHIQGKIDDLADPKNLANHQNVMSVVPSWRNAAELSYVVPPGDSGAGASRAEFVLRALEGSPRVISKAWTEGMTDGFLPRLKTK